MGKRRSSAERAAAARAAREQWGRELRRLRDDAAVSQETVASDVAEDASKSWTSQVESGQIDPPFTKILAFAEAVHARVVLTSEDPWQQLDLAIAALSDKSHRQLKRHLLAIVRDERTTADSAAAIRPKGRAAGTSR